MHRLTPSSTKEPRKKKNHDSILGIYAIAVGLIISIGRQQGLLNLQFKEYASLLSPQSTLPPQPRAGDVFLPGSLNLPRLEVFQKCHIDLQKYPEHSNTRTYRFVNDKDKLVYVHNVKSGSTGVRTRLGVYFNETFAQRECLRDKPERMQRVFGQAAKDYYAFTFSRDPLSRFVSGFQEMLHRWAIQYATPPPEFQQFAKHHSHKTMNVYKDHDKVRDALEVFVLDYQDGIATTPLANKHLQLQSTQYGRPECLIEPNVIHDIAEMETVFEAFRVERNLTRKGKTRKKVYASKLTLNMSTVAPTVKHKICQLTALDYCCLNYALPPECEGAVQCRWVSLPSNSTLNSTTDTENENENDKDIDTEHDFAGLKIEPISPYPILVTHSVKDQVSLTIDGG